jgi:RNA polymerase sigma-70 factor (ECF subfamily)
MTMAIFTSRFQPPGNDLPDLAARVARGENGSFEEFVRLYQSRVARLAHRLLGWGDMEDVVQDVFVIALQKVGGFKGECSLWTWLTVITINRCRSHHRHRRVVQKVMGLLIGRRVEEERSADRASLDDETAREVRLAVGRLKPIHREVVVLFYLEHQSIAAIAELLGTSVRAIEVRLHRARGKLRTALKRFAEA